MELVKKIVLFGECMIELRGGFGETANVGFGGDTLNTAVYLARLGHRPFYATALGEDPWSRDMCVAWAAEGVDNELVLTAPGRLPGLYAIRTDADGERSFSYWRENSAARMFFETEGANAALASMASADILYVTGITLSLFGGSEQKKLREVAQAVRAKDGNVIFDPNYRPKGWSSVGAARDAFAQFAPTVTIALTGTQDEAALYGDTSVPGIIERWQSAGAREIVVKDGQQGATIIAAGGKWHVPANPVLDPLDTTGAGDGFNAGYIWARGEGKSPHGAGLFAAQLAAQVIRYPGAIIPKQAFDAVLQQSARH